MKCVKTILGCIHNLPKMHMKPILNSMKHHPVMHDNLLKNLTFKNCRYNLPKMHNKLPDTNKNISKFGNNSRMYTNFKENLYLKSIKTVWECIKTFLKCMKTFLKCINNLSEMRKNLLTMKIIIFLIVTKKVSQKNKNPK